MWLFMELVQRETPLQDISDKKGIQSLVIGELTIEENHTFTDILHTGLGFATVAPKFCDEKLNCRVEVKVSRLAPDTIAALQAGPSRSSQPVQAISPSDETIQSRLALNTTAALQAEPLHQSIQANSSLDETIPCSISDSETIPYSIPDSENLVHFDDNNPKPSKGTTFSTKCFNINIHGIKKRKCQYRFACVNNECKQPFTQIGDWNAHHRLVHENEITCKECGLKFTTPSTH